MDRAVSDREKYVDKFCNCLDRDITELGKEVTEIKNLAQVCLQLDNKLMKGREPEWANPK